MSALFFSHIRDPRTTASSPATSKSSGQLQDSTPALVVDTQKSKRNDTDDDDEDEESYDDMDSPTTTTIYYYPPSPRESPETSPFPSPASDKAKSPLTAKSDHKLWYLRHHIGLLPSASTSSPEFHHLRQRYHHLHHHHLYHDKDCEFACRSAAEPAQRHATAQHLKMQEEGQCPMSHSPSKSSASKIKSPVVPVPLYSPPTRFEVRRSSANYSLEALKNEKRNNSRPSSRASVPTVASTTRNSITSSLNSSSPRRPVHSAETIQELRESIKSMSHFGSAPSSSPSSSASKKLTSSKVQIAPKAAPTVAVSNNDALPTVTTVTAPARHVLPPGPHNSPLVSRPIEVPTLGAATTTTTTTTTVTTTTTAPLSPNNNGYEQLVQKVDTLAREVEIMKQQQHPYILTSTVVATTNNNNSTGSSTAANSDTPIQAFRTTTHKRNTSIVTLPLPTKTENSSLRELATKNNSASLSTSFLPLPPAPAVRKNSGNNKPLTHRNSYYKNNNSMTRLQNLPPPPSERPPSPPSLSTSSSSSSSSFSSSSSQRGNTPQRQNSHPPLPPSRIPISFPGHPRPTSGFGRSFSLLSTSALTTPMHTAVATATTSINTNSANNVNPWLMTTTATATTTDNDNIMPLSSTAEPSGPMTSTIATTHYEDATSIVRPPLTSNDDNDHNDHIIKKQETQEQQLWGKDTPAEAILSRTRSLTPAPPTVPPPPPPRSYPTKSLPTAQTMTGLTGPPRRPQRPPQLTGVDMKEILSLMDSRLGALPGVPPCWL